MGPKLLDKRKYNFKSLEEQDNYFSKLKNKYPTRWAISTANGYLYQLLCEYNLLDRYYPKQKLGRKRYTRSQVVERIKKFKTRKELTNTNTSLYYLAIEHGILDLYLPCKKNIYTWELTEQVFAAHANGELRDIFINYKGFYNKARNADWMHELCVKYQIKKSKGMHFGV